VNQRRLRDLSWWCVNLICGGINQRRVNQGAHETDWKQREPELLRDRWRLREPNLRRDLPMARESRWCRELRSLREPPLVRVLAMGREPEEEALSG
jgi:hypothetical protein